MRLHHPRIRNDDVQSSEMPSCFFEQRGHLRPVQDIGWDEDCIFGAGECLDQSLCSRFCRSQVGYYDLCAVGVEQVCGCGADAIRAAGD